MTPTGNPLLAWYNSCCKSISTNITQFLPQQKGKLKKEIPTAEKWNLWASFLNSFLPKLHFFFFFLQKPDNVNVWDLWNVCAAKGHRSASLYVVVAILSQSHCSTLLYRIDSWFFRSTNHIFLAALYQNTGGLRSYLFKSEPFRGETTPKHSTIMSSSHETASPVYPYLASVDNPLTTDHILHWMATK